MAKYPALPLFTDAFIADTIHLNAAQTGAYLMLLMSAWRAKDCALPDDDRLLARYARMDLRAWKQNKKVILEFWKLDDKHKWVQERLLDERNYADHKSSINAAAGKASALKRKERDSTGVQRKSNENPTPTPTPTPTKKDKDKSLSKKNKVSLDELSISHIEKWLSEKRVQGSYLTIDEHRLLERFKDYCRSKSPKYKDYVAAFRNSFDWNNTPQKGANNEKLTYEQRLDAAAEKAMQALEKYDHDADTPELRCISDLREAT